MQSASGLHFLILKGSAWLNNDFIMVDAADAVSKD